MEQIDVIASTTGTIQIRKDPATGAVLYELEGWGQSAADANGISIDTNSLALNSGTISDAAGNAATLTHSAVSDNASYLVDTTAPETPVEVALAHDTGDTSDRITNDASLAIAPPEPGTTRTYTVTSNDPNDPNGGSSYTTESYNPALLSDGDYTVTVTDTDAGGNSTSADISFTLDRTISSASAALADDAGESPSDHLTNNAAVEFSELDPDASRVFTVDGTEVDSYDPDTQFEADGSHTVSITDTDTAGNISTASVTFTLDRTADQSRDLAVAVDLSSLPSGVIYDPSAGSFTSVDETGQARGTVSFVVSGLDPDATAIVTFMDEVGTEPVSVTVSASVPCQEGS